MNAHPDPLIIDDVSDEPLSPEQRESARAWYASSLPARSAATEVASEASGPEGPKASESTKVVYLAASPQPEMSLSAEQEQRIIRDIMGDVATEFDELDIETTILCLKKISEEIGHAPDIVYLSNNPSSKEAWRAAAIAHLRRAKARKENEQRLSLY